LIKEKLNILIYLMDSQRPDNMSCYGYPKKTTPIIDEIVKEGVVFINCFTPLCVGKRFSRHTLYQSLFIKASNPMLARTLRPTISEVLNSIGYKTVAFSNNGRVNHAPGGVLRGFKDVFMVKLF